MCDAVALALMPAAPAGPRLSLRVVPAGAESRRNGHAAVTLLSLEAVVRTLAEPAGPTATVVWQLPCGGRVELERRPAAGGNGAGLRHPSVRRSPDGRRGEDVVTHETPVWITGVGAATPLGSDYATIADGLLAGRSGVRRVEGFDVSEHPSQIAGQFDRVPCPPGHDPAEFARLHRLEQLVLWCCHAALRDAGWWERRSDVRVGLVLGIGAEWLVLWEDDAQVVAAHT